MNEKIVRRETTNGRQSEGHLMALGSLAALVALLFCIGAVAPCYGGFVPT